MNVLIKLIFLHRKDPPARPTVGFVSAKQDFILSPVCKNKDMAKNLKYLYVILKFRYIIFASSLYIIEGNFFFRFRNLDLLHSSILTLIFHCWSSMEWWIRLIYMEIFSHSYFLVFESSYSQLVRNKTVYFLFINLQTLHDFCWTPCF